MTAKIEKETAQSVHDYFTRLGLPCASLPDLVWLFHQWPIFDHATRTLTNDDLNKVNVRVATVPTGKRRDYRQALSNTLLYLKNECGWTLPEQKQIETLLYDHQLQWFTHIADHSQTSHATFTAYKKEKDAFFIHRKIDPVLITLMIGIEIAPLSLAHITYILNTPDCVERQQTKTRLRLIHEQHSDPQASFTHYHLPLLGYRLLRDYYKTTPAPISAKSLLKKINHWATQVHIDTGSQADWQHRFQNIWFNEHALAPTPLKDISYPERHVSFIPTTPSNKTAIGIYDIDWDLNWFDHAHFTSHKTHWPHKQLLRASKAGKSTPNTLATPNWAPDNVLPRMLFLYTQELLTHGGSKKQRLAHNTIVRYTSLQKYLAHFPLTYLDAILPEKINQWAQDFYDTLPAEGIKLTAFYFLQFLSVQSLTESLDIERFSPPTAKPSVNAYRLSLSDFERLIDTLIDSPTCNFFRSLYAVCAALLGFFAMLRRGEILRLRYQDIWFDKDFNTLTLQITKTPEGRPKSGHSRMVHTVIPEKYATFITYLLLIKKNSSPSLPLLGFDNEAYHSRELYYLRPISRALKHHFGNAVNFHHLRHSGAHLYMLQGLFLVNNTAMCFRGARTHLEKEMLGDDTLQKRFDHWLEGRDICDVNDAILFDEMGQELGHTHYATTRWSYLHAIDWLTPIVFASHHPQTIQTYSHAELRYLFSLANTSNDLSRILNKIETADNYVSKSLVEKRTEHIRLTERALREKLFSSKSANKTQKMPTPNTESLVMRWQRTITDNTHIVFLFLKQLQTKKLDLTSLNHVCSLGEKHAFLPLTKKQKTALKNLPELKLDQENRCFTLTMACNDSNAKNFQRLYRDQKWTWLNMKFELIYNRKMRSARQKEMVNTRFRQEKEPVSYTKKPTGATQLVVYMHPKKTVSLETLRNTLIFLNNNKRENK